MNTLGMRELTGCNDQIDLSCCKIDKARLSWRKPFKRNSRCNMAGKCQEPGDSIAPEVGQDDPECSFRSCWLEGLSWRKDALDMLKKRPQFADQFQGERAWPHGSANTHQKRVAQLLTQALQRVTDS